MKEMNCTTMTPFFPELYTVAPNHWFDLLSESMKWDPFHWMLGPEKVKIAVMSSMCWPF